MIKTPGLPLASPMLRHSPQTQSPYVRHVAHPHWRAIVVTNDQRPVLVRSKELVIVVNVKILRPLETERLGPIRINGIQRVPNCVKPTPAYSAASGFTSARTAGCADPPTKTCPTPSTWEASAQESSRRRRTFAPPVIVSDDNARIRIGASDGFDLAIRGIAREVCRQLAAGRIDRGLYVACGRINVAVQVKLQRDTVEPNWLEEVIWFMPEMRPNCRSSGVATADAMVCGSAPGRPAPTLMTGKSTLGRDATGRKLKARIPDSSRAAASSDVPIGRRINGAGILIFICH